MKCSPGSGADRTWQLARPTRRRLDSREPATRALTSSLCEIQIVFVNDNTYTSHDTRANRCYGWHDRDHTERRVASCRVTSGDVAVLFREFLAVNNHHMNFYNMCFCVR
jgi:hypothetical protein